MRCVDVIEELAAPPATGRDSAALAEHLADCPRCAAWARRDARLRQLWEATRPEEPASTSWATVWANVSQALDAAPAAKSLPLRPSAVAEARPWRQWAVVGFGIAQAAVLLVAAWLGTGSRPAAAAPTTVEISSGEPVMIESDHAGMRVVRLPSASDAGTTGVDPNHVLPGHFEVGDLEGPVDPNYLLLGYFEAMAE
jgi:hypothetical protein